jgi:hypothetical protein
LRPRTGLTGCLRCRLRVFILFPIYLNIR